jgi:hypothetical protein
MEILRSIIGAFVVHLASCTLIASRVAGDPPRDASVDGAGDAADGDAIDEPAPDFDPEACGLWGQVFLENEEEINLDTGDPQLDGRGIMAVRLMGFDPAGIPLIAETTISGVDARIRSYYCLSEDTIGPLVRGYLSVVLLDNTSSFEDPQYYQYRTLLADPLVNTLFLLENWYPGIYDYPSYTGLYWNATSTGNHFDIPLSIRASRLELAVEFGGGFSSTTGRRARLCATAIAVREDLDFSFLAIGSGYVDLADSQVVDGGTVDMVVNMAPEIGQEYKVFVYYVEDRTIFDSMAGSQYSRCGTSDLHLRSCDCARGVMVGTEGETSTADRAFAIEPITGTCPLSETSFCEDMNP